MKLLLKNKAITLRKEGYTYNEILESVPVAKSTLSLWLRDVGLAEKQKQRISLRKHAAAFKGGMTKKNNRIQESLKIEKDAMEEVFSIEIDEEKLFLIGLMLYWSEGAKQKEHNISQPVCFSNSDPQMVKIFLSWLDKICNVKKNDTISELYIHQTADVAEALLFWKRFVDIDIPKERVRIKKHAVKTNRKNTKDTYHGLVRIVVKRSARLNRKISGWIKGVQSQCPVV